MRSHQIIIILILFSCNQRIDDHVSNSAELETEFQKVEYNLTSIIVDSVKSWNYDSVRFKDYIFSPIDSNKIWLFAESSIPFELDIVNSSWKSLDKKLGVYAYGLDKRNIYRDVANLEIAWIANSSHGLLKYNIKTQEKTSFEEFKRMSIYTMKFTQKEILIGCNDGVRIINKESDSIATIAELVSNSITDIEISDRIELKNACFQFTL